MANDNVKRRLAQRLAERRLKNIAWTDVAGGLGAALEAAAPQHRQQLLDAIRANDARQVGALVLGALQTAALAEAAVVADAAETTGSVSLATLAEVL